MFKNILEKMGFEEGEKEKKDIRVLSRFRRHANPEKDPETGLSLDALNEAGIDQAIIIGCNSKDEGRAEKIKKGFHSPKERTFETLNYMLQGADKEDVVKAYTKGELDTLPWGKEDMDRLLKKENGEKRSLPELVQAIIEDEGLEDVKNTVAERFAWRVKVALNTPKFLQNGDDIETESVTHGPNQEIFLSKVLKMKGENGEEKIGFDNVNEIGGMFQPAEGFEVETYLDENGQENKKIMIYRLEDDGTTIKGKTEYDADWGKIDELAESHRKKRVAEIKESK